MAVPVPPNQNTLGFISHCIPESSKCAKFVPLATKNRPRGG